MSWFDHPGMHGADSHFVDLLAFHAVIVIVSGDIIGVVVIKDVGSVHIIGMIANHFEPGMTLGPDTELFGNFPFKHVKWLALAAHGWIGIGRIAAGHQERILAQYSHKFDGVGVYVGKVVNDLPSGFDNIQGFLTKGVKRKVRDPFSGEGDTI